VAHAGGGMLHHVGEWQCCLQGLNVAFYLWPILHLCHIITREEPEDSPSRACVVGVLVASVSFAAHLMPFVGAGAIKQCDSAMLDDAVMQLATAVESWEGARECVEERVLRPEILLAWLLAFDSAGEMGAARGVLQLASCMLAPLVESGGGEAADEAAGGSSGQGVTAHEPARDGAAAAEGRPAADRALAKQVLNGALCIHWKAGGACTRRRHGTGVFRLHAQ
jgi:hypothetical protein